MFEDVFDIGIRCKCVEYDGVVIGSYVVVEEWVVGCGFDVLWWWS